MTALRDGYDALLLDLDGTLYQGSQAIPGAREALGGRGSSPALRDQQRQSQPGRGRGTPARTRFRHRRVDGGDEFAVRGRLLAENVGRVRRS